MGFTGRPKIETLSPRSSGDLGPRQAGTDNLCLVAGLFGLPHRLISLTLAWRLRVSWSTMKSTTMVIPALPRMANVMKA